MRGVEDEEQSRLLMRKGRTGRCASLRLLQGIQVDLMSWEGLRLPPSHKKEKGALREDKTAPERRNYPRMITGRWLIICSGRAFDLGEKKPFLRAKKVLIDKDKGTGEQRFEVERTGE